MITIRRFQEGDEAQVQGLISGIMNQEFKEDKQAYPTQDLENIPKHYGMIGDAFFVALDDKKIIGTVAVKKEDDRVALLRRLFVAKAYRNRKIGLKLIDRALQFCHEVGYDEIVFRTTSRMVRAVEACQSKGFAPPSESEHGCG